MILLKKTAIIFLLIFLNGVRLNAASSDSLLSALEAADDSTKIHLHLKLAQHYRDIDLKIGREHADLARQLAITIKDSVQLADAEFLFGLQSFLLGDAGIALAAYQKSLDFYLRNKMNGKAALLLNEIGTLTKKHRDPKEALAYFAQALKLSKAANDTIQISNSLNNSGIVFEFWKQYDKALEYYLASASLNEKITNWEGLTYNYDNLATVYSLQGKFDKAKIIFLKAIELRKASNDMRGLGVLYNNLGEMELMRHHPGIARDHFFNALELAVKTKFHDFRKHIYAMISDSYKEQYDYKNALHYQILHVQLKDSLFTEQRSKQILELESQYNSEKQKQQIELQNAQIQRNYTLIASLAMLLLFSFILLIIYRSQQRRKQELVMQETQISATIASQEKERIRIAQDLHDGLGQLISAQRLTIHILEAEKDGVKIRELVQKSDKVLDEMHEEIRNISFNIMPTVLIKNGLIGGVCEFCERINQIGKIQIVVHEFGFDSRLHETTEISLYRVIQEWINNILKYANAKKIEVQLTRAGRDLTLTIEDDGNGFDPAAMYNSNGNGWKNIQTRIRSIHGTVDVDSRPNFTGTTFIANVENL